MTQKKAKTTLTKSGLTKGTSLSLGTVDKEVMPELKAGLNYNEQRTTIYLDKNIYKAAKQYAVSNDISLKDYFNDLLRRDLSEKGII